MIDIRLDAKNFFQKEHIMINMRRSCDVSWILELHKIASYYIGSHDDDMVNRMLSLFIVHVPAA